MVMLLPSLCLLFGDCDGIIYLTGEVTFIDFEYADVNYSAYDIGNYFCEFSGNFLFTCCICFNTVGLKHCFGNETGKCELITLHSMINIEANYEQLIVLYQ